MTKKERAKKEIINTLKFTGAEATIKDLTFSTDGLEGFLQEVSIDTIRTAVKELVEEGLICKLDTVKPTRYFYVEISVIDAKAEIVECEDGSAVIQMVEEAPEAPIEKKRGWKIKEARRIFSQDKINISRKELSEKLEFDTKNTHMTIANLRKEGYEITYNKETKSYLN